jgi:hypothetical protein
MSIYEESIIINASRYPMATAKKNEFSHDMGKKSKQAVLKIIFLKKLFTPTKT